MKDHLFRLIVQCSTLQDFVEASSRLIGIPYWVMDVTFQVLGISASALPYREKLLKDKSIYEQAAAWLNAGFEDEIRRLEKPVRIHDEGLAEDLTVFNIYVSGILAGRMTFFSGETDDETVMLLARACSVYLRTLTADSGGLMENMLLSLIDGSVSASDAERAKEMSGWNLPAPYRFYLVKAEREKDGSFLKTVAHHFRMAQPRSVAVIRKQECMILASDLYPADGVLEQYGIIAGRSCPFSDLGHVQSACTQARYALAQGKGKIRAFEPLGIRFLAACLSEHLDMEMFWPPAFREIREYDRKYNTFYYRTLCAYYQCAASKEKTGRYLGVHLNTVKYRLGQIRQLFGIDPDKQREELSFYITLCQALEDS